MNSLRWRKICIYIFLTFNKLSIIMLNHIKEFGANEYLCDLVTLQAPCRTGSERCSMRGLAGRRICILLCLKLDRENPGLHILCSFSGCWVVCLGTIELLAQKFTFLTVTRNSNSYYEKNSGLESLDVLNTGPVCPAGQSYDLYHDYIFHGTTCLTFSQSF